MLPSWLLHRKFHASMFPVVQQRRLKAQSTNEAIVRANGDSFAYVNNWNDRRGVWKSILEVDFPMGGRAY